MSIAKVSDMLMGVFGKRGGLVIDDTDNHAGHFVAITITEAAAFTTFTATGWTGTITGITFPIGMTIYADITVIKLASGSAIAYYR